MSHQRKAVFYLIITAILWSLGGVMIKQISWHPLTIASYRSLVTSLFLMAYLRKFHFTISFAQIGGALAYAVMASSFVAATKLTTSANAILLQYTAPIYVALFGAWFLKEKTNILDWLTIFIVLLGMTLFFIDNISISGLWGNIFGITSGIGFGWFVLFLRKQRHEIPLQSVLIGNIITALISSPFMTQATPDIKSWTLLILMSIFQLGLPYILYSYAIKRVNALEAILIPSIEPILNPLWILVIIGEKPGMWSLFGGFIVFSAILLRSVIVMRNKT